MEWLCLIGDSMVRQWPDNYMGLFIILSDDDATDEMLQIKSGKKSTGMSFVNSFVNELNEFVRVDDISDDFDTEEYMKEKGAGTLLSTFSGLREKITFLDKIEGNIVKLVQEVKGRRGRSKLDLLISNILEEKDDVKANLVKFQKLLPNLSKKDMENLRLNNLNKQKSQKLIEIYSKNQDKLTEDDFNNEEKVNIDQSLLKITASASVFDNNELKSIKQGAKKMGFKVKLEKNRIIMLKILPSRTAKSKEVRDALLTATVGDLFSKQRGGKAADIEIIIDHSDIRNLLIEKDKVLRDIASTESILEEQGSTLVAEETIDEDRLEDYIKLIKRGLLKPTATKALTSFKLNGTSLYEKVFEFNSASKTQRTSPFVVKILIGSSDKPFDEAMDNHVRESILPERVFREYVSQRDGWRESYKGQRTPDQLGKDTAAGKNYFDEYEKLVRGGTAGVISKHLADFLVTRNTITKEERDGFDIINKDAEPSKQLLVIKNIGKRRVTEIFEGSESPTFQRRYRRWLESNNLTDNRQGKLDRLRKEVNVEGIDFSKEPKAVAATYSILMNERLLAFFGSRTELKNMFRSMDINSGLRVFYHIISLMTNVDLKTEVAKIDSLAYQEGESQPSLNNNPSLLASVRAFADKLDTGLAEFKKSFTEALKQRLKDIEEEPKNYLVIHKNDDIKKLLVASNLMNEKVVEE